MAPGAWSLWLAASWSMLGASRYSEAWSLKLVAVDHDPGTMSSPSIAHDLKFSCDGCQLRAGRMTNFYCKFFHISFQFRIILKWPSFIEYVSVSSALDPRSNCSCARL